MTDMKNAKTALEAKRREKAKIDAEYAALAQQVEAEKVKLEVATKLDYVAEMLATNTALHEELAKYSVAECKLISHALFGTTTIAEIFDSAARYAAPALEHLQLKTERDRFARQQRDAARREAKTAAQSAATPDAQPPTNAPDTQQSAGPTGRLLDGYGI